MVSKHPLDLNHRETLLQLKRELKNTVKRKKHCYRESIMNQLNGSKRNSKIFWKLLKKMKPENSLKTGISGLKWVDHFKSIFTSDKTKSLPNTPPQTGPLDYAVTMNELTPAAYILKPGKACGFDGISNEMISCFFDNHPGVLLNFFNVCIHTPEPMRCWEKTIINPIHKKGSKTVATNYRGISLLCCLGKFFSAILNNRLLKYVLENKILFEEQL